MIDSLNTNDKIKKFVDDFNKIIDFKDNPILSFQFVSLDDAENGDLVWWTFSHNSVKEKYNNCINEFTGYGKGQISRTLIYDDFKNGVYFYFPIGKGKVISDDVEIEDFYTSKPKRDTIGKIGDSKHIDKTEAYLKEWQKILKRNFTAGSTMWISIPHTEIGGSGIIFSSIFIVFNKKIDKFYIDEVYKKNRNFIIDYLIELYDNKGSIKRTKEKLGFDADFVFEPQSFIPKEYSGRESGNAISVLKDLEKKYLIEDNLTTLVENKDIAYKILNRFFDGTIEEKKVFFKSNTNQREMTIYAVEKLKSKSIEVYKGFLFGRMFLLVMHIVGNYSLKESWEFLQDYFNSGRSYVELNDVTKCFRLKGIKKDFKGSSGNYRPNIVLESIIPHMSEVEVSLVLKIAENNNKSNLIAEIETHAPNLKS